MQGSPVKAGRTTNGKSCKPAKLAKLRAKLTKLLLILRVAADARGRSRIRRFVHAKDAFAKVLILRVCLVVRLNPHAGVFGPGGEAFYDQLTPGSSWIERLFP